MSPEECSLFADLLKEGEDWLMRRILHYAIAHDYTKFTSTAEEAWRASITGISDPLIAHLREGKEIEEIECEEEIANDPAMHFGKMEAQKHRVRGIPLNLFLGLFKYYRRAYLDYLEVTAEEKRLVEMPDSSAIRRAMVENVEWYFDRIEIAFCSEWAGLDESKLVQELQQSNRDLALERNKYLTIFDSLNEPVLYLKADGTVDKANSAANDFFPELAGAHVYYQENDSLPLIPSLQTDYEAFIAGKTNSLEIEKTFSELPGNPHLRILFHRLLDFSQKFKGATMIISDITELHRAMQSAKQANAEAEEAKKLAQEALRFLQKVLDALPVPVFFKDNESCYRLVNREFCRFAGKAEDDLLGKKLQEIFPANLARKLLHGENRLFLDTNMLRQEVEVRQENSSWKKFEIFKTKLLGDTSHGEYNGIVGACFDITERSETTEALKKRVALDESMERLIHSLLKGMKEEVRFGDALRILGSGYGVGQTCIFRADETKCLKLVEQWKAPELAVVAEIESLERIFQKDESEEKFNKLISGLLAEGNHEQISPLHKERFSYLVAPIFLERTAGQSFWGALAFLQCEKTTPEWNSNEREIAKAAADLLGAFLTRSEEVELLRLLGAAAESVDEAIVVTDAQLESPGPHILFANPAAEKNSGYKREELIGKSPRIFQGPNTNRDALRHLREDLPEGKPFQAITTNYRKDGTPFLIDWNISPVRDAGGNITHYVSIQRDITLQHEMETRLALASKMESIGSLSAGIAHEINSPAQFIGDNVQFALEMIQKLGKRLEETGVELSAAMRRNVFEEIPAALQDAIDGLERVRKIVHSMKEFAHPNEDFAATDLNRCIETSVTICRNEWKHHAKVIFDFEKNMPQVFCVRSDISQVIVNLVINAAQAIAEKKGNDMGLIVIRTRHKGAVAEIEIEDDGTGIPEKLMGKIFDPFFTTKSVGKGTGQGLFLASQSIVGKHRGHISVSNRLDGGAIFLIQLPSI